MCVITLVTTHAKRICSAPDCIVMWPVLFYHIFPHYFINGKILVIRKELETSGIQDVRLKHKQNWINHLEKWATPDSRNTPSTTNLEEEEIVDAPGNDGNASMPEQVKRPNAWRKIMM